MKTILFFINITLLLIFNACTGTDVKHISQEDDKATGGNPEVYIAHQCLKSKASQTCLEKLFNDKRKAYIQSYEIITLAGRGTSVEQATITFEDDDLFLLYLDISKVKVPLSTNINSTKISSDENSILFILPVKEIGQEIIVRDKEGNIILQYKVRRKE